MQALSNGAPPRRVQDVQRLLERYHARRDPADRDTLVRQFMPLARHLARRYHTGAETEDLEQVAAIGLLKALDRYDPARGIAFTSFAVPTILGEVRRFFRDLGWSVRVPRPLQELSLACARTLDDLTAELGRTPTTAELAARCGVSAEEVLEARAVATAHRPDSLDRPASEDDEPPVRWAGVVDRGLERAERAADVDALLATLPERTRHILRLRFGEDLVQREIAAQLGLSQMHVSRLIQDALASLREAGAADLL